jgi:heptosyltransferase-1
MADILFVKTSSLGDVIHQMPALTDARRHRSGDRFSWIVEEAFAPLARLHPAVDEVIPVASRRWRRALLKLSTLQEARHFIKALRGRRYDEVVDTQGLMRSALITRLVRGRRHGYDRASVKEPAASWAYDVRHAVAHDLHAIERNRLLTGLALRYVPDGPVDYGLSRNDLSGPPASAPYAILFHGTAEPEKEWPQQDWVALCESLQSRDLPLILPWGNPVERERSQSIAARIANAVVPELRPLDEVTRLIAGASFVVGVDTGLVHVAAALEVPLVAIFVARDPALWRPIGHGPIEVVGGNGRSPSVGEVVAAVERIA